MADEQKEAGPVVIKKYANRRLYNTQSSSYVTLDHLCEMVKEGVEFEVRDARTGDDITRSVLTQIIFEEEGKGQNLLPIRFLRQLIRMYGDSMQEFVPGYLDMSMESFAKNQDQMRDRMAQALGGGTQLFENMTRQNMAIFERAMKMFSPFSPGGRPTAPENEPAKSYPDVHGPRKEKSSPDDLNNLKNEVEAMRKQLEELARERK